MSDTEREVLIDILMKVAQEGGYPGNKMGRKRLDADRHWLGNALDVYVQSMMKKEAWRQEDKTNE